MDNKSLSQEWFNFAEADLQSALFLRNMHPAPLEIICYHCQQSVEKYLKGFIALNGGELFKTHDLLILNKKCCFYNSNLSILEDDCINLTDYGVQVRYPFHIDVTDEDMKMAIESAKRIKNLILESTK